MNILSIDAATRTGWATNIFGRANKVEMIEAAKITGHHLLSGSFILANVSIA